MTKKASVSLAVSVALFLALLPVITTTTVVVGVANAQQQQQEGEEEIEVVANVEENNNNNNNNDYNLPAGSDRAEIIDNQGNVINPGGENPQQAIAQAGEETMSRPTNLENLMPHSIRMQEFEDMQAVLRLNGYAIADVETYPVYGGTTPVVIVRGIQGVTQQPDLMTLEEIGALYGYAVFGNSYIDNAQLTIFIKMTTGEATATVTQH